MLPDASAGRGDVLQQRKRIFQPLGAAIEVSEYQVLALAAKADAERPFAACASAARVSAPFEVLLCMRDTAGISCRQAKCKRNGRIAIDKAVAHLSPVSQPM
jgi:hypothetical protein